jgi:hypothetical protein
MMSKKTINFSIFIFQLIFIFMSLLTLLFAVASLTSSVAHSSTKVIHKHSVFVVEPYSFLYKNSKLSVLSKRQDLVVDHPTSLGFEVYGDDTLFSVLDSLKIKYKIKNQTPETEYFFSDSNPKASGYPSFNEMEKELIDLAKDHSKTVALKSIGKSVELRNIWSLQITNASKVKKMDVLFIANIHGNEITGRDLMLLFAKDIINISKNRSGSVYKLLDTFRIHIVPSLNPDGAERRQRTNANRVDLNRDFPDWTRAEQDSMEGREPEVQAIMNYYAEFDFKFSANFHSGAEVINYPWDNSTEKGPLEDFLEDLSFEYVANGAQYMKSNFFPTGVTRGYEWYPVFGGLQDWSTHYKNSPHLTIELSNTKWPAYEDIDYFYENNKSSLFQIFNALKN